MKKMKEGLTHCVYAMGCAGTNRLYIGKTSNPKARYLQHLREQNDPMYEDIKKYGRENFYLFVIKSGLNHYEALYLEAIWIFKLYFLLPLYNRRLPSTFNPGIYNDQGMTNLINAITNDMSSEISAQDNMIKVDSNGRKNYCHFSNHANADDAVEYAKTLLPDDVLKGMRIFGKY